VEEIKYECSAFELKSAHFTVVRPSQSAAVTITWNMDPSVAATKTN